ncbi:MAG: sugar phosphate isomerase/epimerase family protein [bacterium]
MTVEGQKSSEEGVLMNRRTLIKTAIGAGLLAGVGSSGRSSVAVEPDARPKGLSGMLKLSSQDGRIPGKSIEEKVAKLEKWGGTGLELGGGGLKGRVESLKKAIKGTAVKISAICAGFSGVPVSHDPAEREKAVNSIKELLAAAGELESTGLIVVPAFNNQTTLSNQEARKIMLDMFPALGEHAVKCGTRILLEPLNRGEAFFLRQLADAAAICRDINSPGVCVMGDFYHMNIEETSDMGAFISAGKYLHHVHLASGKRNLPGQDARSFVDGFRGLKMIGFTDYCSLECGCKGDPEVEIPKSFALLRQQWEEATV